MIIGAGRSGKSSLGRWLYQQDWVPGAARGENPDSWNRRIPTLVYRGAVIEAPGAYLESQMCRRDRVKAVEAMGAEGYSSVVIPRPHPHLEKIIARYSLESLLPGKGCAS